MKNLIINYEGRSVLVNLVRSLPEEGSDMDPRFYRKICVEPILTLNTSFFCYYSSFNIGVKSVPKHIDTKLVHAIEAELNDNPQNAWARNLNNHSLESIFPIPDLDIDTDLVLKFDFGFDVVSQSDILYDRKNIISIFKNVERVLSKSPSGYFIPMEHFEDIYCKMLEGWLLYLQDGSRNHVVNDFPKRDFNVLKSEIHKLYSDLYLSIH